MISRSKTANLARKRNVEERVKEDQALEKEFRSWKDEFRWANVKYDIKRAASCGSFECTYHLSVRWKESEKLTRRKIEYVVDWLIMEGFSASVGKRDCASDGDFNYYHEIHISW